MGEEKQKMLAGEDYHPLDSELSTERKRAKALCHQYNNSHPDERGKRQQILSRLIGKSHKATIEANFFCDYGYNISLGDHFFANHNCTLLDAATITIGSGVLLGPGVNLSTIEHPTDPTLRAQHIARARPIALGDNVWLAMGVQVLPGVNIGANTTVAAGAVVTQDLPANCVAAGVPAKVVKYL
ncbi:MAG: sugar O-acetyltransferase [Pseudomonadales bacterium]